VVENGRFMSSGMTLCLYVYGSRRFVGMQCLNLWGSRRPRRASFFLDLWKPKPHLVEGNVLGIHVNPTETFFFSLQAPCWPLMTSTISFLITCFFVRSLSSAQAVVLVGPGMEYFSSTTFSFTIFIRRRFPGLVVCDCHLNYSPSVAFLCLFLLCTWTSYFAGTTWCSS
jgi:hypothetical protein